MKRAADLGFTLIMLLMIREWLGFEIAILIGVSALISVAINSQTV